MYLYKIITLYFYFVVQDTGKCAELLPHPSLVLYSAGDLEYTDVIVKRVNDSLALTCEFRGDVMPHSFVWNFLSNNNSVNRALSVESENPSVRSNLTKVQLQLSDTGQYICSSPPFSVKKYILVQPRVLSCARGGLTCGEHCVLPGYVCDGYWDCPRGEDEAALLCGTDQPCRGADRLNCSTGRCIPEAACCPAGEPLCQQHPCCDHHPKYSRNEGYVEVEYPALFEDRHAPEDYGFIQSTIYTVTACALIFMIAVVLLVSAICKMHMKRAALRNYAQAERATRHHYNMQYAQVHRFPPCYEASRLLEAANNRSQAHSPQGSPLHANNQQATTEGLENQNLNGNEFEATASPVRPNNFGLSRLGTIFSSRYRQVPTQSDVELTDVRSNSLNNSPTRTRDGVLDNYRSPTFCNLSSEDFYFTTPGAANCGRDLNYMATPLEFLRQRNALGRIEPRPLTLQLGRFHLSIPRFGRRRSVELPGRRPDTPNVAEINIDELDFVRLNSNETYTLNGRTIRLLGANFENYPSVLGNDSFVGTVLAPPPYSEIVSKAFGPPPEYLSRDDLTRNDDVRSEVILEDLNGNMQSVAAALTDEADSQNNVELPPQYDDLGNSLDSNAN